MTLASSGTLSIGGSTATRSINLELGLSATANSSIGQTNFRTLAGVSSGTISLSNFYGKSSRPALTYTFGSPVANASLNVSSISGYIAGVSDITVTINSGVYLYATSTGSYGLNLSGGSSGDTLKLVNNGFIMGQGGVGAGAILTNGNPGGPALNLGYPTTIDNTNGSAYIGGGGGGGPSSEGAGGGGGAGGGDGGTARRTGTYPGGAGGAIGSVGGNASTGGTGGGAGGGAGGYYPKPNGKTIDPERVGGGGGGRIFPGSGGGGYSYGGGNGGAGNAAGGYGPEAGGGGGWGASAGGTSSGNSPGTGGKAVNLNGKSVTWVSGDTSRIYGSVS